MYNTSAPKPTKWYQTIWGVLLVGFGVFLLVALGVFLFTAGKYWYEIKQGRGEDLYNKIYTSTNVDKASKEIAVVPDRPVLGADSAPVTIVEFIDFRCSNCLLAEPIIKQVLQKYGTKVKLVVRDFPIESLHTGATKLAEIARCAYEQNQYWAVHDWIFDHQSEITGVLTSSEIEAIATTLGLDISKLNTCLSGTVARTVINRDYVDGYNLGISGTPAFFVNGTKIEGVVPFAVWEKYLSNIK